MEEEDAGSTKEVKCREKSVRTAERDARGPGRIERGETLSTEITHDARLLAPIGLRGRAAKAVYTGS